MPIIIDKVSHIYGEDTAMPVKALNNISLVIPDGQFIGLIGHTGSGKSTLVQHLNGLMKATSGNIYFNGEDIDAEGYDKKLLRSKVGLVFQYPEHQLFETDVFADVCFGPKNLGLSKKEVELRAYEALKLVGLEDEYFYQSPFDLSGGQKRRVAIAGVLAMRPEVLVLDEPTAGLDPKERVRFRNLISRMGADRIILLSTHIVSDIEHIADTILVMKSGQLIHSGSLDEIIEVIKGKVWECTVPQDTADVLTEKYPIINTRNASDGVFLRLVCDEKPCENAVNAEATLEDLYLYYFSGEERTEEK